MRGHTWALQVCGNQDSVLLLHNWLLEWKCGGDGEGEIGWINGQLCNTAALLGPVRPKDTQYKLFYFPGIAPHSLPSAADWSTPRVVCLAERERENRVCIRMCRRAGVRSDRGQSLNAARSQTGTCQHCITRQVGRTSPPALLCSGWTQVLDLIGEATQSRRLVLGSTPTASAPLFGSLPDDGGRGGDAGSSVSEPAVKGLSLILFDEADVVFEDDKGFEAAVQSLIETAKCPILLTCHRTYASFGWTSLRVPI